MIIENIPALSLYILCNISNFDIINKRTENLKFTCEYIINENLFIFNFEEIRSPFLLPLKFRSEGERDFIKDSLLRENIYPPILWDIEESVPCEYIYEREFSKKMLTIPIDQRYKPEQLLKPVQILNRLYKWIS